MYKKIIRFLFCYPALLANLLAGVFLLVTAYSGSISPVRHPLWSTLHLAFPIACVLNGCFLVYWLAVKRTWMLVPLSFYLLCIGQLWAYCPMNFSQTEAKEGDRVLTLLSFNTMNLYEEVREGGKSRWYALDYLVESDADILCVQEFPVYRKDNIAQLSRYPYQYLERLSGNNGIAVFSKYPILHAEKIKFPNSNNGSISVNILFKGDTLLLINNHLESNKLGSQDKEEYNELLKAPTQNNVVEKVLHLISKLGKASAIRSTQADSILSYVQQKNNPYTIVCGDLNDAPNSYTYGVFSSSLKSAFAEKGRGVGFSYTKSSMFFRIDHIFVGNAFKVLSCKVDDSARGSDHYPIRCVLALPHKD